MWSEESTLEAALNDEWWFALFGSLLRSPPAPPRLSCMSWWPSAARETEGGGWGVKPWGWQRKSLIVVVGCNLPGNEPMSTELPKYETNRVGSCASATRTPSAYEKLNLRGVCDGSACSMLERGGARGGGGGK